MHYVIHSTCPFLFPAGCSWSPISLMHLLRAAPRWTDGQQERGVGEEIKREVIQSMLLTQEQHFVVDFREWGEKEAGCGGLETDLRWTNKRGKGREYILIYCHWILVISEEQKKIEKILNVMYFHLYFQFSFFRMNKVLYNLISYVIFIVA